MMERIIVTAIVTQVIFLIIQIKTNPTIIKIKNNINTDKRIYLSIYTSSVS